MTNRTLGMMMMAAVMTTGSASAKHASDVEAVGELTICLSNAGQMKNSDIWIAKKIATTIFADAGIELHWTKLRDCPANGLGMEFRATIPENEHKGALGYAYPFAQDGIKIVILMDRVKYLCTGRESSLPAVFGHVLAHEIGHVLLGTNAHSDAGVMQAKWSGGDWTLMAHKYLTFTPMEGRVMRGRVTRILMARN